MRLGLDDDAVLRIRAEFREMPGLKLTAAQATRLWQLEPNRSEELLNALVVDGLLRRSTDGAYLISSDPSRDRRVRLQPDRSVRLQPDGRSSS